LAILLMVVANYAADIQTLPAWLKHAPDVGLTAVDLVAFDDIPITLSSGRAMHGDIVIQVPEGEDYVITIGGNLGNSARRRRYPLDDDRRLVVNRQQLYTQEDDSGDQATLPGSSGRHLVGGSLS
jgi:hypothetical protein